MARTFVDRGGTFTDVLTLHDDGGVEVRKVPSDRAVVGELAQGPLVFGTTVATNALLERAGVPTLLVVNAGLEDLVFIGDMTRPELFEPAATWPDPLCTRVVGLPGRIAADGSEVEPLPAAALELLGDALRGVRSVAVALLHSPRNPTHELAVAAWLGRHHPEIPVSLGHRCSPEVGLLSRIETTLVDAAISPVLHQALRADRIPPGSRAIRSDGSLCPADALRAPDAVLSGPAGGVLAVAAVAELAGFDRAVGLDMGGTSTDVCRVDRGSLPRREGDVRVAGVRLRRPMLEVHTIAAGGGSVLWNDGLRLGVGPSSAGADPGPQCYGRGGPATLTDAALLEGLVDPSGFTPPLDPSQVALPGSAAEFLEVARDQMAAAIRTLATARGIDLQDHALVGFGGAAGAHAAQVAERLGISTVLFHPCSAVLSAWGQVLAREEATAVRAIWADLPGAWPAVELAWRELRRALPPLGTAEELVELRHSGTDFSLTVEAPSAAEAERRFTALHRQRMGFDRDGAIEVVNARVRVVAAAPALPEVVGVWGLAGVLVGPHTLHLPTTTIRIPDGWEAREERGLLRLDHRVERPRPALTQRTPYGVALWGSRFMAVAEQAGTVLQRLARSVNIRERLDFSCAVFDGRGQLVANAPHIPVHLGAMGATVRDLLRTVPQLEAGQSWLCNDPAAGGSHLPDLTVVTAVEHQGHRFFTASRGHHVDVGGSTPGSMPPHSRSLAEEGFVIRHLPLLDGGQLAPVREWLVGCREPETVLADLRAQIAANHHGARLLVQLGPAEVISAWMAHLQDVAAEATARVLDRLPNPSPRVADRIGGLPLSLQLTQRDGQLHVDFSGTGGPDQGNLNAPPAVVRAAVLYSLRVLIGEPIPLNEGVLRQVVLHLPDPSLVHPPETAAVAGGNVETSQRIVDLMLRAAGHMAASAGTMSNLTLGGPGWSLYETIGAGQGASPSAPGPSARQIHMTNTRATDPEVLEQRLPLRLRRFQIRQGSGGHGAQPGGHGLIREIELLENGRAALLATRRDQGAPGLAGGGAGQPGSDALIRQGTEAPWDGRPTPLKATDRVRIESPGGGAFGLPMS